MSHTYMIKSADSRYVKQTVSDFELTRSATLGTKWKKYKGASQALHCIKVHKCFNDVRLSIVESNDEDDPALAGEVAFSGGQVNLDFDVRDKARDLLSYARNLIEKKDKLWEDLTETDREIVDIQHAAEFYKLSASDGYKLYSQLHQATQRRRRIKEEIAVIEPMLTAFNQNSLDKIDETIKRLDAQEYRPRTNAVWLFDEI